MRRTNAIVKMALGLGVVGAAALLGCFDTADDCEQTHTCAPGTGGGGGGGNPACAADPTADPAAVIEDCGVFVAASAAPGGDGTKARPFQSFTEMAAAGVKPKRVYACAETYAESAGVSFEGGVEIYAGFTDCAAGAEGWTWSAAERATLEGPADAVAMVIQGGDSRVVRLNVVAANAATDGGSSIAVVASGGTLAWVEGDLMAGDARDGAAGSQMMDDPMLNGEPGDAGAGVCMSGADNPGPMGKTKTCATGGESIAGKGGDGGVLVMSMPEAAGSGGDGTPADATQPTKGIGGLGEGQGDPPAVSCSDGTSGANGAAGESGAGAAGAGMISAAGYGGVNGTGGTAGKPGQGGGGGGGAKGGLSVNCGGMIQNRVGASGGAGGTGGCGGNAGGGGQAGGASIALVVLDAEVTLEGVRLAAGRGGAGGKGGDGQSGGTGAQGGNVGAGAGTAQQSCGGGNGGQGGVGGPGGGGQGGHSLGIAFQGSIAPAGGEFSVDPQNVGIGGSGGLNNATANGGQGADGMAENCWDFGANAPCGGAS